MPPQGVRWFADESVLGFGKLLSAHRTDVIHMGDPRIPELPLGSSDIEWMPIVAAYGWVAFHRDRRIRTRPAELAMFREAGLKAVWFGGRKDLRPSEQVTLALKHWVRMEQLAIVLGQGPWAMTLTGAGVREYRLPAPEG